MLIQEIREIKGGPKEIRSFSRVVGSVLAVLGGLAFWHGKAHYPFLLGPGILLLIPQLTSVIRSWMRYRLFEETLPYDKTIFHQKKKTVILMDFFVKFLLLYNVVQAARSNKIVWRGITYYLRPNPQDLS